MVESVASKTVLDAHLAVGIIGVRVFSFFQVVDSTM
jgi:hypothetical protein